MPSPDLTQFVDLRIHDRSAQEIFETALVQMQSRVPEYQPRETGIEIVLLEAMALEVEHAIFAINRLPGSMFEVLLRLFGIDRNLGVAPTTSIRFTLADTAGHTIPEGTTVAVDLGGGLGPISFITDFVLLIPPGQNTGTVAATGGRLTSEANGIPVGTPTLVIDSIAFVDYADIASTVIGGVDPETEEAWRGRASARFARLNETLVLPRHFVQAALEKEGVFRAYALDNYNPTAPGNPGTHPGHISVAVYGENSVVPQDTKNLVADEFDSRALSNLVIHVIDPTVTDINVTATVKAFPGYDAVALHQSCEAAIRLYLSPLSWQWESVVRYNELIGVLDRVEGVHYVDSLTLPAGNVAVPGFAPLVRAGTLNITVIAA